VVWKRGQPLIELNAPVVQAPALFVKRVSDLVVGSIGLFVVLPVFAVLALLIKLDSPGECFYPSERWGQRGRKIRIWKFRTMVDGAARVSSKTQRFVQYTNRTSSCGMTHGSLEWVGG